MVFRLLALAVLTPFAALAISAAAISFALHLVLTSAVWLVLTPIAAVRDGWTAFRRWQHP